MRVKNAVYLNADRTKAVPAGHEEAAFLLVGANGELSESDAKKYHVTETGASGQKESKGPLNVDHMVTDATPDGINTSPDSPQAKEGMIYATTTDNVKGNKSGVTITRQDEKPSATGLAPAKKRG